MNLPKFVNGNEKQFYQNTDPTLQPGAVVCLPDYWYIPSSDNYYQVLYNDGDACGISFDPDNELIVNSFYTTGCNRRFTGTIPKDYFSKFYKPLDYNNRFTAWQNG